MSTDALDRDAGVQARVVAALAARALRSQFRRAQFLLPSFVLPLLLLAVVASGTSSARRLPGFPSTGAYVGFVVAGTLLQGALLAGLTAGIALAADIEGGFFDRLLTAPVQRVSIVLGRVSGSIVLGVVQASLFLAVAFLFGARYQGGVPGIALAIAIAALAAGGMAGLASAIALRTGSLSLLQNLFPIVFVFLFTAPAFFPRAFLGGALRHVTVFNPLTYVVEGIRGALHDAPALGNPWRGILAAVGLLAATTALSVLAMRGRLRTR
ncbi:MAG TPA: ABC transporter permease [Solirubrobacteraceae bacterium]|nr:ABC transporter permease [Solirubrobacteraceae bacterium]